MARQGFYRRNLRHLNVVAYKRLRTLARLDREVEQLQALARRREAVTLDHERDRPDTTGWQPGAIG